MLKLIRRLNRGLYIRTWNMVNRIRFDHLGKRSYIRNYLLLQGSKNVWIGDFVYIAYKCWIAAVPLKEGQKCILKIGKGTHIGNFCHIYATQSIAIGEDVLIADRVYISDNMHNYKSVDLPIIDQSIKQLMPVTIGSGSWIGENVCVIGANIGRNCVIGANSVVNKDIPDYCVAVGAPARIIKKFCHERNQWCLTDSKGVFLEG
ncbi:acyltransferase [Sphingobacterium spiritivorum]|nr:acyltransferase [Sphingobacterium spiritivorum]